MVDTCRDDKILALEKEIAILRELAGVECYQCKGRGFSQCDDGTCSCTPVRCFTCYGSGKTHAVEQAVQKREIDAARAGGRNYGQALLERLGEKHGWGSGKRYSWRDIFEMTQELDAERKPLEWTR